MDNPEMDWTALQARLQEVLEEVEHGQIVNVATLLKYEQLIDRGIQALESLATESRILSTAVVHLANAREPELRESDQQTAIMRRWHQEGSR